MAILEENTTLDNFRVRLGALQHTFDSFFTSKLDSFEFYYNVFTPTWIRESNNEFIKIIVSELDPDKLGMSWGSDNLAKYDSLLDLVSGSSNIYIYLKEINKLPRKSSTPSKNYYFAYGFEGYRHHLYKLIYWWLVVLALDNDLYNKYLDYVVDAADIFGFTEDMMDDWCNAVIYWLNGNEINRNCRLQLKTNEGKLFFRNGKFTSNKENRQNISNNEKGGLFEALNSLGYNVKN